MTQDEPALVTRKKLIEVALPLDAINKASKREKSIRHGHPSTLHLWWSRKPLATARAVIFAQMVDDPSANKDLFPTKEQQDEERQRLCGIIEELVQWENTTNEAVLERAREEIWQSWRRTCSENATHPRAEELFDRDVLPTFHDPFAGGGSLPLEAQRLGLEAHASDLNPIAVLINKAMIEIPPRFAGRPPVHQGVTAERRLMDETRAGAHGLADDVRYYSHWMRDEAERRIGHLYPRVRVTSEMAEARPDLAEYVGRELTVIAWLWARTVKSPSPAFSDVDVPLASTFVLSTKEGREAYVEPTIERGQCSFEVKVGKPPESAISGTKVARGNFICLASGTPIPNEYVKSESKAGRVGSRLIALVAEGDRRRVYLSPTPEHEVIAHDAQPDWRPPLEMQDRPRYISPPLYGLGTFGAIFTDRQLVALNTFSDLVQEARVLVQRDATRAGVPNDGVPLRAGGTGAAAYADAVSVYLAFALDKYADYWSGVCTWHNSGEKLRNTFVRQALPLMWDYAEANPMSSSSGSANSLADWVWKVVAALPATTPGTGQQSDARSSASTTIGVYSTDPPYYDNVAYADLMDFFYVWMRRVLGPTFPDLLATLAIPKEEELVASPDRHGSRARAETFFLDGMTTAMRNLRQRAHPSFPVTVYYAFKQSEGRNKLGAASTGWETFLEALISAGFSISGTWPMRTEMSNRMRGTDSNALASSIVLACRPRANDAPSATRREFQEALREELAEALTDLQRSNIAPVDIAQASIGPGMAVFTRYSEVLNADGSKMSVGSALTLINAALDEVLAEQEGHLDDDSRWAVTWFEQHGYAEGEYGLAEQLSKAKNTSVDGLAEAGIIESRRGAVRILEPSDLDADWDPSADTRLTVWEMTQHLIRLLESGGEQAAGELAAKLGSEAEAARDLAYRLYVVSERKGRAADALAYNGLVQSWPEIMQLARQQPATTATQSALALDGS